MHISEMGEKFPEAFEEFNKVCKILEDHYRDMQDMEFTVEHGKLYMLQTRNGKRTAQAALKMRPGRRGYAYRGRGCSYDRPA